METFMQALQIAGVGMVLVFMSLVIVAGLIWGLDRLFRPAPAAARSAEAPRPRPSAVISETSGGDPISATSSAKHSGRAEAQAAALAVAIVRVRNAAQPAGQRSARVATLRAEMPWERPAPVGEEIPEAETVTVITVGPGQGNWKSQGRLRAME